MLSKQKVICNNEVLSVEDGKLCTFKLMGELFSVISKHSWSLLYTILFKSGMCPIAGCGHVPGLLTLFSEKYKCVCTYLPMFVCPYAATHVSNFSSGKCSYMHKIKANPIVSFGFQSNLMTCHRLWVWLC